MSTNQSTIIIQFILVKIQDDNCEDITTNLVKLPLTALPLIQSDTLIAWFLAECTRHQKVNAARTIINIFDEARIRVDPLPAITQIFLNPNINRETLSFVMMCFPEKRPIDYYVDLININCFMGDIMALKAAVLINTIFPNVSGEDWSTLLKLTDSDPEAEDEEDMYPNQALRAFFQTKVAETGTVAPKPEWVREYPVVEISPLPNTIPSVKEAVDLLIDDLKRQTFLNEKGKVVDIERNNEVRDTLITQYAISTIPEKILMLSQVRTIEPVDDIEIFREYGPVNSIYSVVAEDASIEDETSANYVCGKYGGCRMITCSEFETMYADGEEIDVCAIEEHTRHIDWFRNSCDRCLTYIPKRHYAVRRPLLHGGWKGCFCSFEHMTEGVTDPQVALMIGRMKEQMYRIGIRDR
ncbi:Hypothetical protein HVR_LOCUS24 [uncultured virus]|nr:Hypothetical protein HVR_LOCUS24 [uncultured virus]